MTLHLRDGIGLSRPLPRRQLGNGLPHPCLRLETATKKKDDVRPRHLHCLHNPGTTVPPECTPPYTGRQMLSLAAESTVRTVRMVCASASSYMTSSRCAASWASNPTPRDSGSGLVSQLCDSSSWNWHRIDIQYTFVDDEPSSDGTGHCDHSGRL
jgi:hypothetical protein